jgi:hypothetical protein
MPRLYNIVLAVKRRGGGTVMLLVPGNGHQRPWNKGWRGGYTDRKGYSRPVVSVSSVNVIANPVRVAPIPKLIAHVPTNIVITTSGVRL